MYEHMHVNKHVQIILNELLIYLLCIYVYHENICMKYNNQWAWLH